MKRLGSRLRRLFVPASLRFQLLSRSLLVMAVLLLLIGIFQYVFMREFIFKNKAESIQAQIMSIPKVAWKDIAGNVPAQGPGHPFFFFPDASIAYIDSAGNVSELPNFINQGGTPLKLSSQVYKNVMEMHPSLNYQIVTDGQGIEQLVVLQPLEYNGSMLGLMQVNMSTKPLMDVLIRQFLTFLSLSLLALIGGMLAFIPVLRRTLIPLSNMVDTVEQIDAGNLAERFPAHQGQSEIDRLAESFNGMLERLEASFEAEKEAKEQMRRFVADASHELRTPLTSIHGFLEVLLRGAMNHPDQLKMALKSMYGESERINKLVHDLLLLAKLDRTPNIQLTEGELDSLIKEMEPQLRLLAGHRKVDLRLVLHTRCRFDEDKMKQVLLNLFQNAVQHTHPENGHIEIYAGPVPVGIQIAVKDNGMGILNEHLPHLFDRFYRSDSSRTRKYGGAGLGLSITKSIVEVHGGTISAESRLGEGSTFYVLLPSV
jgi:two-component system, OmpR family, sensor kinase